MQPSKVILVKSDGFNLCDVDICRFASYKKYSYSSIGEGQSLSYIKLHNYMKINKLGSNLLKKVVCGDMLIIKMSYNKIVDMSLSDINLDRYVRNDMSNLVNDMSNLNTDENMTD
jgi:hypothetical protein